MEISHTKVNHKDERGEIHDILAHEDVDAVTYITYEAGAVRANHFHEHSVQWDYVISGSLECYSRDGYEGDMHTEIIHAGDLVKHPIGEHHALKALEASTTLSLTKGPRQGEDYENDVIRLEVPLVT
ncbi:cupin domain-containing protein [Candidatus Kaiserbacteria bacterium]|nr:cupin domain-containing protein [Candidatus Kaiserbacteria bacterium]